MTIVALYTHESATQHGRPMLDGRPIPHPEQPDRIPAILNALDSGKQFAGLVRPYAPLAAIDMIKQYHAPDYVDRVTRDVAEGDVDHIDGDTHRTVASTEAALRAVGAACDAVKNVASLASGTPDRAFVAMRPPGHHAETARAMGFCLFGTVAIAAQEALKQPNINRVAAVDFDVHHGNGTQDLLWDQPNALFITSQQVPLWPGSGAATERGAHGQVINLPLEGGSDGQTMRQTYQAQAFPAIRDFAPDMILISAGFDAHADDPLAGLNWTTADFGWLSDQLVALAVELCEGRVVSCLEGGYDLPALAESAAAHISSLMR